MRFIKCPKHGLIQSYFCRACKIEKYVQAVKEGKIEPKELIEYNRPESELLPLQIRFRAYLERSKRSQSGKVYAWEHRNRAIRVFPSRLIEGNGA